MIYLMMGSAAAAFGMVCVLLADPRSTLGAVLMGGLGVSLVTLLTLFYTMLALGGVA